MGQMDFGPHTLQIFVSLIVVLAVAGVALVCDLLKGNNEHLRELAVELKVRNEEAERRILVMEKKGKRTPDFASTKAGLVNPMVAAAAASQIAFSANEMPMSVPERAPEPVRVPLPKIAATETARPARPERRRREMSPAVAAVAQAAAAIVNNKEHQGDLVAVASGSSSYTAVAESSRMSADGRRKNWDSILKKTASRPGGALIPFESIREAVPAGFHEAQVLQRSVESGRTVSGLVVSIGTNAISSQGSAEVSEFIQGLLTSQDFACQSGTDEYIIVCVGEQGAAAQRRLSAIAEKLWDFQLRSIGSLSVQFSWGSFEARGERIGEAVAASIEQMQETRQSRRANVAKAV